MGPRKAQLVGYERASLRPWVAGACVWLGVSVVVIIEYLQISDGRHLHDLWLSSCLFWAQFGFAGLFHTVRKEKGRNIGAMLLITVIPPMVLHVVAFTLGTAN